MPYVPKIGSLKIAKVGVKKVKNTNKMAIKTKIDIATFSFITQVDFLFLK